jgi:hypothetical protein
MYFNASIMKLIKTINLNLVIREYLSLSKGIDVVMIVDYEQPLIMQAVSKI